MSEKKPISELNSQIIYLMCMVNSFRRNDPDKRFEGLSESEVCFKKMQLIRNKIIEIIDMMIGYDYYLDKNSDTDLYVNILQNAFAYIEEYYQFKI